MIIGDFSKIKIGNTDISSVYMGGEKLWPKGADMSRRIMRFTTTDGNTWNKDYVSAYTADDRLIEPIEKTSTGWTYGEDVEYLGTTLKMNTPDGNLLTFKGFDTKIKIKDAFDLFYNEGKAKEIDTKNFDTSQATDMGSMFANCSSLTSLDVSNFNTSKVDTMENMFANCSSLTSLDVSNFNTSQVTDMSWLFSFCVGLTFLDLSSWNTSKVTTMTVMFDGCNKLASLDLSNWDTSQVTDTSGMFGGCAALKTITMKNCTTETIEKIKAALAADKITGVEIIQ